jgi:hypothetical protein
MAPPSVLSERSRSRRAFWRWSEMPRAITPSTSKRCAFGSPPVANGLQRDGRKPASEKRPCGWVSTT